MSNAQITTFTPTEMPAEELALAVREYQLAKLPAKQRAAIAIGAEDYKSQSDALKTEASKIVEVKDKATRGLAHDIGMGLKRLRTGMESTAKTVREGAVEYQKAVIAVAAELSGSSKPAEDEMFSLRDRFDAAEKTRKDGHESAIRAISARAILPPSMPSGELQAAIDATHAELAAREWEEYAKQAKAAADATLAVLEVTLALAVAREEAEAKARAEAERAEAERLAREAAEREAREAAEREAARIAGLKARLIDLELGIARQIRGAKDLRAAQELADAMATRWAGYWDTEAASWGEFADDAADVIEAGHADAMANLERLLDVAAAEMQAVTERAERKAAEREAAELAQKIAAEQAAIAAKAVVDDPAPPSAPKSAPSEIRWGELCAAMGCEIPPWVLEQLGCQSEAGSYTVDALRSLRASLGDICARLDAMISE